MTKVRTIRVEDREWEKWKELAKDAGLSLTAWIKEQCLIGVVANERLNPTMVIKELNGDGTAWAAPIAPTPIERARNTVRAIEGSPEGKFRPFSKAQQVGRKK